MYIKTVSFKNLKLYLPQNVNSLSIEVDWIGIPTVHSQLGHSFTCLFIRMGTLLMQNPKWITQRISQNILVFSIFFQSWVHHLPMKVSTTNYLFLKHLDRTSMHGKSILSWKEIKCIVNLEPVFLVLRLWLLLVWELQVTK